MDVNMEWNVCRICLQEADDMKPIFGDSDKEPVESSISERIMQCSSIIIKKGMNLPEQICGKCFHDLNIAYQFRTNCESSAAILLSILESTSSVPSSPAHITDMTVNVGSGEVYRFRPPSGLKVKRLTANTRFNEDNDISQDDVNITTEIETIENEDDGEDNETEMNLKEEVLTEDDDYIIDTEEYEEETVIVPDQEYKTFHQEKSIKEEYLNYNTRKKRPKKSNETSPLPKKGRPKKQNGYDDNSVEILSSEIINDGHRVIRIKRLFDVPKPLKICEICGNTYKYQHALNSHMRRHRNEKPFTCEICSKGFVINFELSRHMRTHTGQKPYGCKYCDRKFSDFGSRIKHERTHTGERPYSCETCGKSFAYSHVLSSHMLTHTGVKNYECPVCSKRFTKAHHLKAHRNTHERTHVRNSNQNNAIKLKEENYTENNFLSSSSQSPPLQTSSLSPTYSEHQLTECADECVYENVMTVLTAHKYIGVVNDDDNDDNNDDDDDQISDKINIKLEEGNVAAELIA